MANKLLISYKIPVKSYMLKILSKLTNSNPYTLSMTDPTGRMILGEMIIKWETSKSPHFGDKYFEIIVPKSYWRDYRIKRFSESHASGFLDYHYELFISNLFAYIDSRLTLRQDGYTELRMSIRAAIVEYCDNFNITDDEIAIDTLSKSYYRKRDKARNIGTQYVRRISRNLSESKN